MTHRAGKFAILLHADVAGSTSLVQQDEHLAHERIQTTFRRFGDTITRYHGRVRELRGDALLAEFERASDAVTAALAFQADQAEHNAQIEGDIRPTVRVGIAMGEVVFADRTVTGAGVVLAQRMEQLAEPGGVCITAAIHESLPQRMPFEQQSLGEQEVKGFDEPVRVYTVQIPEGTEPPGPAELTRERHSPWLRWVMTAAVVMVICGGGLLAWYQYSAPEFEPAFPEAMALPLPDKPSIAVLPFDDLTNSPEYEYLVDGLTDNITTELSRFKEFFVIDPHSTSVYKDEPVRTVAEELGVRYVVEGSVQMAEDTVRVTAQLIDAVSGRHLWADRYDRELEDIFTVQDEITRTIVATVDQSINLAEYERVSTKPVESLEAFELIQRADAEWQKFTREGTLRSKRLLDRALEIDPNYSEAYSLLAWVYVNGYRFGWSETHSRDESLELALETAQRSVELDPFNYATHQALAHARMYNRDLEEAVAGYDRALELNPSSASLLADSAEPLVHLGRAEEAIPRLEAAMRLNPRHPDWYFWALGWAQYFAGRYDDALASLNKINQMPNGARRALAPVLVRLGRLEEARAVITEFLKNEPDYTLETLKVQPMEDEKYLERWTEDLRKAGVPEHPPLELPDKPSIVVLPFDDLSPTGSDSQLADAITETLIATLAQVQELFVIARNSAFTYKGEAVDVRQVGRELGVRHVLEGSLQQTEDNVRVTAQLIDATTGEHLWAERYDRPVDDLFALQDDIAFKVLVSLQGKLIDGADAALRSSSTDNVQAYLRAQNAMAVYFKWTKDAMIESRRLADEALGLDPDYAFARLVKAWTHYQDARNGYSGSPERSLAAAEAELDRVQGMADESALSPNDEGEVSMIRAQIALLRQRHDLALEHGKKTVTLLPGHADLLASYGWILLAGGQPEQAIDILKRALRLNPKFESWQARVLALALTLSGDHEAAITAATDAIDHSESDRNRAYGHMIRAIAYAQQEILDKARPEAERGLAFAPYMTVEWIRSTLASLSEEDMELITNALQTAGVPE